jgi:AraC-like DNA-binding protein
MANKPNNRWPLRRSSISAQLLTQFGLDHGLSVERCLAGSGLSLPQLAEPGREIDASQELALISNLVNALRAQPGIGLNAGQRYHLSTYGIWGFALLSSPTFRNAASLGLRYLDLTYAFCGMRLEEHGEEVHLVFEDRGIPAELRGFILERDSAGMLNIQRDLLGHQLPLIRVDLCLPRPPDCTLYIDSYGIEPRFAQAENRFVIAKHLLEQPLPGANPQVARHCEEQCTALLAKRRERAGMAGQVRACLLSRPGCLPDMENIAQQLHLSSRTLRRRLLDEGTHFRVLLEEVRQALAEELLATGGLTLEEIAARLGYAEVSNFIHAFKRWRGLAPHQYRQRHRDVI